MKGFTTCLISGSCAYRQTVSLSPKHVVQPVANGHRNIISRFENELEIVADKGTIGPTGNILRNEQAINNNNLHNIARTARSAESCTKHMNISFVVDVSLSHMDTLTQMTQHLRNFADTISVIEDGAVFRPTSYTDKPLPHAGVGSGRGFDADYDYDFCFYGSVAYTDPEKFQSELKKLIRLMPGDGGSAKQNLYEALAYASLDPFAFGDRVPTSTDTYGQYLIAVTNDFPHRNGDATSGVVEWNEGFFKSDFYSETRGRFFPDGSRKGIKASDAYSQIVDIKAKMDGGEASNAQIETLNELLGWVGPSEFKIPEPWVPEFNNYNNCQKYEYPTLGQLKNVFDSNDSVPFVLVTEYPSDYSFTEEQVEFYGQYCVDTALNYPELPTPSSYAQCVALSVLKDLETEGIEGGVSVFTDSNGDELMESIVDLIMSRYSVLECPQEVVSTQEEVDTSDEITKTVSEDSPTTEEEVVTSEDSATTEEEIVTSEDSATTEEEVVTSEDRATTDEEVVTSEDRATTEEEVMTTQGSKDTTTTEPTETTEDEAILPPLVVDTTESEDNGVPVGPIVGAVAGGVALLAGAAYSAARLGFLNKPPPAIEVEDEPYFYQEDPLDRERMEDLSIDMFA